MVHTYISSVVHENRLDACSLPKLTSVDHTWSTLPTNSQVFWLLFTHVPRYVLPTEVTVHTMLLKIKTGMHWSVWKLPIFFVTLARMWRGTDDCDTRRTGQAWDNVPPTMRRVRQSFFVALKAYDTCHSCVSEHQKTCPSFEGGHNDICECLFMLMH